MTNNHIKQYLRTHDAGGHIHLVGPMASPPLQLNDPVIFVDGGAMCRENNIGIVVGDGDSFNGAMDHCLDPDKDFSDLAFALSLVDARFDLLYLRGFLGGRRDHELFNLGEVNHFLSRRTRPAHVLLDDTVEAFSAGNWQFHCRGLFSLLVFVQTSLSLSGDCHYAIAPGTEVKPVSSFGLSNQGYGDIQLMTEGPAFIVRQDDNGA